MEVISSTDLDRAWGEGVMPWFVQSDIYVHLIGNIGAGGLHVVVGDPGMGKSALARAVATSPEAPFERRVLAQVREFPDLRRVRESVDAALRRAPDDPAGLVVLDGLDEHPNFATQAGEMLARIVQPARAEKTAWVVTARRYAMSSVRLDAVPSVAAGHDYRLYEMGGWTRRDIRQALETRLGLEGNVPHELLDLLAAAGTRLPRDVVGAAYDWARQSSIDGARRWLTSSEDDVPFTDLVLLGSSDGAVQVVPGVRMPDTNIVIAPDTTLRSRLVVPLRRTRNFYLPAAAELEALINDPNVREQTLQQFFETYPELLRGLDYERVIPHPVLVRKDQGPLIPDFMLEPAEGDLADVLDLKLPAATLVAGKKDRLRPSAALSEAVAQVREYQAYFDEPAHRQAVKTAYGVQAYRPRAAVVIGRRPQNRDALQLRRLWMSLPGDVQVVTYDDLMLRIRRLGSI
jgi:hypothetical protein